jgi:hypothetical protein
MLSQRVVLLALFLLIIFIACQEEKKFDPLSLIGRWKVAEAYRNDAFTKTLEDAIFVFNSDMTMFTNLLPDSDTVRYTIQGNEIQSMGEETIYYHIDKLSLDTLSLTSEIHNSNFLFVLTRDTLYDDRQEVLDTDTIIN